MRGRRMRALLMVGPVLWTSIACQAVEGQSVSVLGVLVIPSYEGVPNAKSVEIGVSLPVYRSLSAEAWFRAGTGTTSEVGVTCVGPLGEPGVDCVEERIETRGDQVSWGGGIQAEVLVVRGAHLRIGGGPSFHRVDVEQRGRETGRRTSSEEGGMVLGGYGSVSVERYFGSTFAVQVGFSLGMYRYRGHRADGWALNGNQYLASLRLGAAYRIH